MKTGDVICLLSLGSVIGIGAAFDLRTKKIPVILLVLGTVGLIAGALMPGSRAVRDRLIGMIPGFFLLAAGLLWHMVGTGDSVLILLSGFGLGVRAMSFFLTVSLMCLLPAALFLIVTGRRGRKDTLPFFPFAAVGLIVTLLLGVVP